MEEIKRCSLEKDGFIGVYFPGKKFSETAIIAAGGASCDKKTSISMCRYLRKAGYNVLVLGFYMWNGMSKELVSIPVDYVENAVKWLKMKNISKNCNDCRFHGAGYTLLAASLIPDISCVVPVVTYDYVMEGTTSKFKRLHKSV